jgi:CIC family chloride channel protein
VTRDTIYTLKLRRRGVDIEAPPRSRAARVTLAEAMEALPEPLAPSASLETIIARLTNEHSNALPVTDAGGALLGVVTATDAEQAIDEATPGLTAASLARAAPELRSDETIEDAIAVLAASNEDGVPILLPQGDEAVGWLTHRQLLRAYQEHSGQHVLDRDQPAVSAARFRSPAPG